MKKEDTVESLGKSMGRLAMRLRQYALRNKQTAEITKVERARLAMGKDAPIKPGTSAPKQRKRVVPQARGSMNPAAAKKATTPRSAAHLKQYQYRKKAR